MKFSIFQQNCLTRFAFIPIMIVLILTHLEEMKTDAYT